MRRFLIYVVIFFVIVVVIDFLSGKIFDYFNSHSKGGEPKEMYDFCMKDQYDIVIMGSSRAHHHYVPEIFKDSLKMTCFNAGQDGNGIILMYGKLVMVLERYKPQIIIYDVAAGFDIYENPADQNNTRYLSQLKPYINQKHIAEIFESISKQEYMKNFSGLYRYNSKSLSVLKNHKIASGVHPNGYQQLEGSMAYEPNLRSTKQFRSVDSLKLHYFEKFANLMKLNNIEFICALSPRYKAVSSCEYAPIKQICDKYEIPILDFYTDTSITSHREYFKDATHMNNEGAKKYTNMIVNEMKNRKINFVDAK